MKPLKRILVLILAVMLFTTGCNLQYLNQNNHNSTTQEETDTDDQQTDSDDVQSDNEESEESEENEADKEDEEVVAETTMYAQTGVNVRKGPGTSYDIVGKLSKNEEVTALGDAVDGWQKILYNGEEAYVSAEYLGLEKVESTTSPEASSGNQVPEITEVPDLEICVPEGGGNGILIVIDAGHQGVGNKDKEPDGPGSSTMKAKVSSGTSGCASGWHEYQLNLVVSMKLKEELLARGYSVAMIRETHEINISNATRAEAANKLNADAFIRIHANSSTDPSIHGALTICQTPANPYNGDLYEKCRRLSDCVLDGFVEATGAYKKYVWETDTMSGINWCQVPVTIVEMGFMSNPDEDLLMATEEYQDKMVLGMANGIDAYFENQTDDEGEQ